MRRVSAERAEGMTQPLDKRERESAVGECTACGGPVYQGDRMGEYEHECAPSAIAPSAVQHLIHQVENGEPFDRSVMLKALRSVAPSHEKPCETCNDDPAVCATVPGLRH
jgi:hypothetical protein